MELPDTPPGTGATGGLPPPPPPLLLLFLLGVIAAPALPGFVEAAFLLAGLLPPPPPPLRPVEALETPGCDVTKVDGRSVLISVACIADRCIADRCAKFGTCNLHGDSQHRKMLA